MGSYQIYVTSKKGIFDPAGETSKKALVNLGYEGVSKVRIGKFIELECDDFLDEAKVREMCEKLLANPVIEDYRIEPVPSSDEETLVFEETIVVETEAEL